MRWRTSPSYGEWRKEASSCQIGLKDRQRADSDSETIDHRLECDEEMVEYAPPLLSSMRQTGMFQPIGPIARTCFTSQQDMVCNISWLSKGRAFEQRRTHD